MTSTSQLAETNHSSEQHKSHHDPSGLSAPTASPTVTTTISPSSPSTSSPWAQHHSPTMPSPQTVSNLSNEFRQALSAFAASPSKFQLLRTITSHGEHSFAALISSSSSPHPKILPVPHTLYVLDSSFNPPTRAHRQLVLSALRDDARGQEPKRLLLLLATQNADKAPKPASFQDRLVMMTLFAQDILRSLAPLASETTSFFDISSPTTSATPSGATTPQSSTTPSLPHNVPDVAVAIDIGITKEPYFVAKSLAITETEVYGPNPSSKPPPQQDKPHHGQQGSAATDTPSSPPVTAGNPPALNMASISSSTTPKAPIQTTQVWLTGYDTLTRLMDPKYYPPAHTLAPLEPFLSAHRVRATLRPGDTWGGRAEQEEYLVHLATGGREHEGGKREWAERIELVPGSTDIGRDKSISTAGEAEIPSPATTSHEGGIEGAVENEIISSTRVREACRTDNAELLKKLVTDDVAEFVLGHGLYKE